MTEKRILVTGATGMMGRAVARRLASTHHVFGVARFGDVAVRRSLEDAGVECIPFDLCVDDLSALPGGIQVLMHFAVSWNCTPEAFAPALAFNGFLIGRMLDRWPDLEQFVLGSTVAVYTGAGRYDLTEDQPTCMVKKLRRGQKRRDSGTTRRFRSLVSADLLTSVSLQLSGK